MTNYRLAPAFSACMRWAFTYFLAVMACAVALAEVIRHIRRQPMLRDWTEGLGEIAISLFFVVSGMGILIFVALYAVSAVATAASFRASTYWGRRVEVPWSSITSVRIESQYGVSALIVSSDQSKAELYVFTLGLDWQEAYSNLVALAGHGNLLTKCFQERLQ